MASSRNLIVGVVALVVVVAAAYYYAWGMPKWWWGIDWGDAWSPSVPSQGNVLDRETLPTRMRRCEDAAWWLPISVPCFRFGPAYTSSAMNPAAPIKANIWSNRLAPTRVSSLSMRI